MEIGDRVTGQPKQWYDGTPIKDWPDPQFLGTVKKIVIGYGLNYVKVKFDSGRTSLENIDALHRVD